MAHWIRSYALLLRWTALRKRYLLPLNLLVQAGIAVGVVIGFSFLIPTVGTVSAIYLAAGAPVIGLIVIGMVIAPTEVSQAKLEGSFEFIRSFPVPRTAVFAADSSVALATAFPGLLAGLGVAALRFDLSFDVSWLAIVAFVLIALASICIGYGFAYALSPAVTSLVSQAIVFISLMFAPINFPADRLPDWLARVHDLLPFTYMAQSARETLFAPPDGIQLLPFAVVAMWCIFGVIVSLRIMSRRE